MEYIKKLAQNWNLTIDPDFKSLLPRDHETMKKLEAKILAEGCRDPLVVWRKDNSIVDGNTRYEICRKHNICFAVQYMDFESKAEAMRWEYENQDSRRNLTKPQLIEIQMKIEEVMKAEARAKSNANLKQNKGQETECPNLGTRGGRITETLADMAGVGHTTYEKGATVFKEGPEEIKELYREGKLSTDAAYKVTNMPEEEQKEVIEGIAKGEKTPKQIISDVVNKREGSRRGWTKEDRENRAATLNIIDAMKGNTETEYTLDMLVEDIQINSTAYFDTLYTILEQHSDLINYDSKPQVCGAIEQFVVNAANELRRKIA